MRQWPLGFRVKDDVESCVVFYGAGAVYVRFSVTHDWWKMINYSVSRVATSPDLLYIAGTDSFVAEFRLEVERFYG